MNGNDFCGATGCKSPADFFYFQEEKQTKFCSLHFPSEVEQRYPIEEADFVKSPELEAEYLRRSEEEKKGKENLEKLLNRGKEELTEALLALEEGKKRAMSVVVQTYEAEERRTKQHFHQVEILLEAFKFDFTLYLTDRTFLLSKVLQKIVSTTDLPCVLQTRTLDNSIELARVITTSVSRVRNTLDRHLDLMLDLDQVVQLISTLKTESQTDSFYELQKALAGCEELLTLKDTNELKDLRDSIEIRVTEMKKNQEEDMTRILTADPDAINSLLQVCSDSLQIAKAAGNVQEVDKLYMRVKELTMDSKSMTSTTLLKELADWNVIQSKERWKEAKNDYQEALLLCTKHFPTSILTVQTRHSLGLLLFNLHENKAAKEQFLEAIRIAKEHFQDYREIAYTWHFLGIIYRRLEDYSEAVRSSTTAVRLFMDMVSPPIELVIAHNNLGVTHKRNKSLSESLQSYIQGYKCGTEHYPVSSETLNIANNLGKLHQKMKNFVEAEKCFKAALDLCPMNSHDLVWESKTLYHLGKLYGLMQHYAEAERYLNDVVTLYRSKGVRTPWNVTWAYMKLQSLKNQGDVIRN